MKTKLGIVLSALVCLALPVAAHHGFDTEYDRDKPIVASGVVSKVEWTNPHMRVYIDVTAKDGKVTTYNMEMTSPNTIRRRGWTMNTLLPGEKVVFEGYLGRVVESRGALQKIAKAATPDEALFSQEGPDADAPGFPTAKPGNNR
jgi:alkylated DNA nucleotide flippase Atl1